MKRYLDYVWPLLGLVAVVLSVKLLYEKLKAEAASDLAVKALLDIDKVIGGETVTRLANTAAITK